MQKHPDFDETARQIWQGGLDALARAQAQGSQVLDALVQEGLAMQRRTQAMAGSVAEKAQAAFNQKLGDNFSDKLSDNLGQQWSKLEGLFEERVARTLQRLGLPTAQELQALKDRIARLEAELEATNTDGRGTARATKTAARKKTTGAAKTAARKTPTRKTAAKQTR
ncbi:phasin family protein [Hylemonella gracilis]|uniref:Poly(Hydroxyalkanoate) granule-associated protein n=1 Tax=Hylemonella gracilis ATCC 19624 TaxID=887062 RepID=F3KSC2_9BURK|nr:phasin family protein [Hylemonella gracilis]EGI77316.1 poly(hydroxyalkanoate) granule-associated protein [Hylemonella gracilis ATCC 19624]